MKLTNDGIQELRATAYQFIHGTLLPPINWPQFNDLIVIYREKRRASTLDTYTDVLPALSALAAGGTVEEAAPLCAAWILLLLAARLFDDVQDGEGFCEAEDPARRTQAISSGLFAVGAAQSALSLLAVEAAARQSILDAFGRALSLAARTQATPLTTDSPDLSLATYFKVIAGKTGIIFATGAWCGARLATADRETCQALHEYGLNAGMMIQVLDDRDDLVRRDLPAGALTLPAIYGLTGNDPAQTEKLRANLQGLARDSDVAADTAVLLQEMGALTWCQQVAHRYQQQAIAALSSLPRSRSLPLLTYVTRP